MDSILSYCHYNLLNNEMDGVLTGFAEDHGIGLINASGLHMGLLTDLGPQDWHPAPPEVREAGKKAAAFCRAHGADIAEVALRFCIAYPHVASTLVGMGTTQEVEAGLKLLQGAPDPELLRQVETILAPVFNYAWPSGRPENQA